MVATYPFLSPLFRMYRVSLVIDANVVLADLRWLAKRKNPRARTNLQEVLAAGTVVAYAPPQLETEIRRHMPRVASEAKLNVEQLEAEWEIYRKTILFRTPAEGARPERVQDPDDLPYLYLRMQLDAEAIYTDDTDLEPMGAPVIGKDIVVALRDYSRAASVEMSIKMGGTVVFVAGTGAMGVIWKLLKQLGESFSRLPRGFQLVLAGAVLVMLAHPQGRMMLRNLVLAVPTHAGAVLKLLLPLLDETMVKVDRAKGSAEAALSVAKPALGPSASQPLRVYARRVLLREQRRMHVNEIARLVVRDGYVTRAKDLPKYLTRVLGSHPDFTRGADGAWAASAIAQR
jgi:predicted nucleic acid-binding protein